jgi:hypothetical protein
MFIEFNFKQLLEEILIPKQALKTLIHADVDDDKFYSIYCKVQYFDIFNILHFLKDIEEK